MSSRSNASSTSPLARTGPSALAVLSVVCGLLVPRSDAFYVLGHSLALVLALAVPLAYGWLNREGRSINPKGTGVHQFLFIGLSIFAVISAVSSVVLLSFGSTDGAAGDIGGIFIWLVSSAGLLVLSIAAAIFWPRGTP